LAEEVTRRVKSTAPIEYIPYSDAYGDDFEDVRRRVPDLTRLTGTIGSKPKMSLGEILDDVIRWKREERSKAK
jgi:UDP-glucose 4-epimerase